MYVPPQGQVVRLAKARFNVLSTTGQMSSSATTYHVISMSLPVSCGVLGLEVDSDGCHVAAGPEKVRAFGNQMSNLATVASVAAKMRPVLAPKEAQVEKLEKLVPLDKDSDWLLHDPSDQ